ncbi:MAG: hypothetical protein ISS48_04545 [Candidatus Aenigmarchaeota archaeon]|nr:hypothetical protein [Candidatus Aenigmarchaeota archaeon]
MIRLIEITPRDGIQRWKKFIPTKKKIALSTLLIDSGFETVEVTSFHPKNPQFKDATKVLNALKNYGDRIRVICYDYNGVNKALNYELKEIVFNIGTTDLFEKQFGRTTKQALEEAKRSIKEIKKQGVKITLGVSSAFGTPNSNNYDLSQLFSVLDPLVNEGVNNISLADSYGIATPEWGVKVFQAVSKRFPKTDIILHFHNGKQIAMKNLKETFFVGAKAFTVSLSSKYSDAYTNPDTLSVLKFLKKQNEQLSIIESKLLKAYEYFDKITG